MFEIFPTSHFFQDWILPLDCSYFMIMDLIYLQLTPPPTAATTLPRFLNWNLKSGRNLDEPLSLINLSFSICKMRRSNNGSKICFITGLLGGLKEIIYLSVNSKVSNINASFCCTSSEMRKHRARGIHDLLGRIALNWEKGWTWLLGQGSCTYPLWSSSLSVWKVVSFLLFLISLLSLPGVPWRAAMSGNPASSSEQNNNSYETKTNLRMSEKKCCEWWERGRAALSQVFVLGI